MHVARGTDGHDEANGHSSRLRERVCCHSLSCRSRQGLSKQKRYFDRTSNTTCRFPKMHAVLSRTHLNLVTSELRYIVAHVCTWLKASTPQHAQPPTQRVPGFSPHSRQIHRPRREADHSLHLLPTLNAWLSTSTTDLEVVHK